MPLFNTNTRKPPHHICISFEVIHKHATVSSTCKGSNFGVCHLSRLVLPDSRNWDSQQKGGEARKVIRGKELEPGDGACLGLQTGASSWECRQGFPVVAGHGTSSSGRQEQRLGSKWNHPQRQGRSELLPHVRAICPGKGKGGKSELGLIQAKSKSYRGIKKIFQERKV